METSTQNYQPAGKKGSIWLENGTKESFGQPDKSYVFDVAVVGGGITGITTAMMLRRAGKTVALIEARKIIHGVTGHTTAKITSLHGIIYSHLISSFGRNLALQYGEANQVAIEQIAKYIEELHIDCDFSRQTFFAYTRTKDYMDQLRMEVDAAQSLGLPASFQNKLELPFQVECAIRYENQAQFHPTKYLMGLINSIKGEGLSIWEETRGLNIKEGEPCIVETTKGEIRANDVVIATNFPFYDGAPMYFARMHASRSYVMAARLKEDFPDGMYIQTEEPGHSLRKLKTSQGDYLIIGGEEHKVGQGGDTLQYYQRLEDYIRQTFPVDSIDFHWSTQDNITVDGIPYIGRYSKESSHVYVATGFAKWGMTTGTVAAMILTDKILGNTSRWSEVYDPTRFKPLTSAKEFISQNLNVAQEFIAGKIWTPSTKTPAEMKPGEGAVTKVEGEKIGVYKDEKGTIYGVDPVCTHMGCTLSWNNAELSWDCPCHGSRFDHQGTVIHGPATSDLKKKDF